MRKALIVLAASLTLVLFSKTIMAGQKNSADNTPTNQYSTMTLKERIANLGLVIPEDVKERFEKLDKLPHPTLLDSSPRFDWRDFGRVTPVKDQGGCGSCWDFAATGAFESSILIADDVSWNLSEQQVLSCNSGISSCNGGWMEDAYNLFMDYGAVEESCMPYHASDTIPCIQDECDVAAVLQNYEDIPFDLNSLKNALLNGPLSTTLMVYDDFNWNCYDHPDWNELNHAVVIVGWDDNLCGGGAWLVKNSWGPQWGHMGYFQIPYGSCGIGRYSQLPIYDDSALPEMIVDKDSLIFNLSSEGEETQTLTLENTGGRNLYYNLIIKTPTNQDSFGYYWLDSESPQGPDYSWIDITTSGEQIDFGSHPDNDNSGKLPLGFDFTFYGVDYNSICVCTNGWASFTEDHATTYNNYPLPAALPPNALLAPYWDDLTLEDSGSVYLYTNQLDTTIVSWVGVDNVERDGEFTFQVILVAPDTIIYQYNDMGPGGLDRCSIGMENDSGRMGLQVANNEEFISGHRAIQFLLSEPMDWADIENNGNGIIPPLESTEIPITCSAGEHSPGSYDGILVLSASDPNSPYRELPIIMNVGSNAVDNGVNTPNGFIALRNYPNPFNATTTIEYSVPAKSHIELSIYNLLGQKVATLVDGYKQAGTYSVGWDAENVSSGVYYYRLASDDWNLVQKMVLLK